MIIFIEEKLLLSLLYMYISRPNYFRELLNIKSKTGEKETVLWIAFEPNKGIFLDFQITIGKGSLNSF
jgi:hypothetical protein